MKEILLGRIKGLTCIYGESGTGKPTICAHAALQNLPTYYYDLGRKFSPERLIRLGATMEDLKKISVGVPNTFKGLIRFLESTPGFTIIDSLSDLFKLEYARNPIDRLKANKGLIKVMKLLKDRDALVTFNVYCNLRNQQTEPVGGQVVTYTAQTLIKLTKLKGNCKAERIKPTKSVLLYKIGKGGIEIG